ncbi:serine/threonine protein kinase [Baia soyae]|uniref:Serine/threonine protein kinase n=1 Tax=Baia soyae TaxID=1544746 RepID=A0A4R2RLM9_9BACL|nr:serine/threonine protein kinase [Baia soyae]TCP64840.1 hypothetical protein EDD57_13722 [Baia soyae]
MSITTTVALLKKVSFRVFPKNLPVTDISIPPELRLIGTGTDAIVVQDPRDTSVVYKLFHPDRLWKKENEWKSYQQLGESSYFAKCYGSEDNYLILSYESGLTLLECLEQGVEIPEQVLEDVDEARSYARSVGLNPRDIHLKNVFLQEGRAKLIDISEYVIPGNDYRWDHLVEGYRQFYPLIRGMKIPKWMIEYVKKLYLDQNGKKKSFSVSEFGKRLFRLFSA